MPGDLVDDPVATSAPAASYGQPGPVGGHRVVAGHGPHDDRVAVRALVAHHADRADVGEHGERLPDLPLQPGGGDLLAHDGVGLLQQRDLARGVTSPMIRTPSPGPGNGWRHTISSGRPSSCAEPAHLVLEQVAQRLDQLAGVMSSGRPPTLWWLLITAAVPSAPPRLDEVGVQRALHEELGLGRARRCAPRRRG